MNKNSFWLNSAFLFALLLSAAVPPPGYSGCVTPVPGLVGWWTGDGNAWDLVGDNNGTLTDQVLYSPGKVGQAFYFGWFGNVDIPASPSLDVGVGSGLTIEAWFSPRYGVNLRLAGWADGVQFGQANGDRFRVPFPYPFLYADLKDTDGTSHYIASSELLELGSFQHVAVTYDRVSGTARLYRNGAIVAEESLGHFTPQTSHDLLLGGSPSPTTTGFFFLLDEVGLYNRALDPAEIADIFNADSAGKCRGPVPPSITRQPQADTVAVGRGSQFSIIAAGSPPLYYQWYFEGNLIPDATGSSLTLPPVSTNQAGAYTIIVRNLAGSACSSNAVLSVIPITGQEFLIKEMSWHNSRTVNFNRPVYRPFGIATSHSRLFLSDGEAYPFDLESLDPVLYSAASIGLLACNLRTETIYAFDRGMGGTATCLVELYTLHLGPTGVVIPLSTPLHLDGDVGIFSGVDRVVVHNGFHVYDISLPSGQVTDLGPMRMPRHQRMNGSPYWGLVESFGDVLSLVYVLDHGAILRTRVPDGQTAWISNPFSGGDGFALTASLTRSRWFMAMNSLSTPGSYMLSSADLDFIWAPPDIPLIPLPPVNQVAQLGGQAAFTVTAYGQPPLAYQWQFNGNDLPGATDTRLCLSGISAAQAGQYRVVVANSADSVTSLVATLDLAEPPAFTLQPVSATVDAFSNVTFTVAITGTAPHLQWRFQGVDIPWATGPSLTLRDVTPADAGAYTVVATNVVGAATSLTATLTVQTVPLAEALNSGSQVRWTTTGDRVWFGQRAVTYDGEAAVQSPVLTNGQTSRLQADLVGPGTLTFWWKTGNQGNSDSIEMFLDNSSLAPLTGRGDWQTGAVFIPGGRHAVAWTRGLGSDLRGTAWLDQVQFLPGAKPAELSLDTQVVLAGGGNVPWIRVPNSPSVFRSGHIDDSQYSSASLSVMGPGRLSFWWKVSSEPKFDILLCCIDSWAPGIISGNVDWRHESYDIPSGQHTIQWIYEKDGSFSGGQDAAWIRGITFTPEQVVPVVTIQPGNSSVFEGGSIILHAVAQPLLPLNYRWIGPWPESDGFGDSFKVTNAGREQSGDYYVLADSTFAYNILSGPALVTVTPRVPSQVVLAGSTVCLRMNAAGLPLSHCSWETDFGPVTNGDRWRGAGGTALFIKNVQPEDSGRYYAMLASTNDTTLNFSGQLTVLPRGSVLAWGDAAVDARSVPEDLTNVIAIAAGMYHSLALRADNSVVAWGGGQLDVPEGLSNVVALAAGDYHSLALRSDGTVVAWGDDSQHQTSIPDSLSGVIAIAAGSAFNLALKADGTVVGWGDNQCRQTDVPGALGNVTAIAAGANHALAVTRDGEVVAWGDNSAGQCNVPSGLANVAAVAASTGYSLALKRDGTVVGWGLVYSGQTIPPRGLNNVIAIAAAENHCLALRKDGKVVTWGRDPALDGFVGVLNPIGVDHIAAIAAGRYHNLALRFAPAITLDPASQSASVGDTVTLTARAVGREPMRYQWRFQGRDIPGATDATLTIPGVRAAQAGKYTLQVTNDFGQAVSTATTLVIRRQAGTIQ